MLNTNERFYKHPTSLIEIGDHIHNWMYGVFGMYATEDGYIMMNPLLLVKTLAGKNRNNASSKDINKLKDCLQFLIDEGYITICKLTANGLADLEDYDFRVAKSVEAPLTVRLNSLDGESFTKVYKHDFKKLLGITFIEQTKLFLIYIFILKKMTYGTNSVQVSYKQIKIYTNIAANKTISTYLNKLKELEILNFTNKNIDGKDTCYTFARFVHGNVLGSDAEMMERDKDRMERNRKRSITAFTKAKSDEMIDASTGIINANGEVALSEKYIFEEWNNDCPMNTYLKCENENMGVYIDGARVADITLSNLLAYLSNPKITDNPKSILNKLNKETGAINIVTKGDKGKKIYQDLLKKYS